MKKLAVFLLSIMLMILIPANIQAQGELDITSDDITIDQPGTYSIDGKSQQTSNNITISENLDEVELTINNLIINSDDGPAIKVENGTTLTLILEGDSKLEGSDGYAGISVEAYLEGEKYIPEKSANLIIIGNGTLEAIGGDGTVGKGGGAGIGGDGFDGKQGNRFGTLQLNGGKINARGGSAYGANDSCDAGAGAGIGSGGAIGNTDWYSSGIIIIDGSKINSIGGKGQYVGGFADDYYGAGAGIGAGGANNTSSGVAVYNDISITIKSGYVKAQACEKFGEPYGMAAGIGGCSNGDSGEIVISGGVVYAYGGKGKSYFSGAGIGTGDNVSSNDKITIKGDATVYAFASDASAAIGGGSDSYINVEILDNANVYAYGGQYAAGIGSGFSAQAYGDSLPEFTIEIDTSGEVVAYGGSKANAIGHGQSPDDELKCNVIIGENVRDIKLFVKNNNEMSVAGITTNNELDSINTFTVKGDKTVYWSDVEYAHNNVYMFDGNQISKSEYTWEGNNEELRVLDGSEILLSIPYESEYRKDEHHWMVIFDDSSNDSKPDDPGTDPDTPNPSDPDQDNSSPSKPSSESKPQKVCDVNDLNCDGVITCEELLGKYWNWDEVSKSCIYTKQVVTDSIIVNTSTK